MQCFVLGSNSSSSNVGAIFSNASENTSMSFCITYICTKQRVGEKIFAMGLPPATPCSNHQDRLLMCTREPGCQVSWKHWHMELNLQYGSKWRRILTLSFSPASLAPLILAKHDALATTFNSHFICFCFDLVCVLILNSFVRSHFLFATSTLSHPLGTSSSISNPILDLDCILHITLMS